MPQLDSSIPRRSDFGVGKWSRIATYGTKRQEQADGSWRTFEFNDAAFSRALQNFKRMFAGRGKGMGSDYEHQTLNAPTNGQPAPNLCFWGAMAVINESGQLAGMEDLRGDSQPIDPMAERVRLAEQNPAEDSDPAGVWALCSEVTPLGEKLIPNYSQLSPLFSDSDVDEQSQPVGFAFQNVSFVNVAFQGGTSFNFSKGAAPDNEGLRAIAESAGWSHSAGTLLSPDRQRKMGLTADGVNLYEKEQNEWVRVDYGASTDKAKRWAGLSARASTSQGTTMNEPQAPDMMGKLTKFGFLPDKPESAETAYAAYMEGTEDPADERKKVAEMYRQMRAKMAAAEPQSAGPGSLPTGEPSATPPELAAPGVMGKPEPGAEGMAKMQKIFDTQMGAMSKRVEVAEKTALAAQQKLQAREDSEQRGRVAAFRKEMLEGDNARYLPEQASALDSLLADVGGDVDKARKHAELMPPVAAFSRLTHGGNPVGMKTVPAPGFASMSRSQKGTAFNKAVSDLRAKEPGMSFAAAQQRVATEQPELYRDAVA